MTSKYKNFWSSVIVLKIIKLIKKWSKSDQKWSFNESQNWPKNPKYRKIDIFGPGPPFLLMSPIFQKHGENQGKLSKMIKNDYSGVATLISILQIQLFRKQLPAKENGQKMVKNRLPGVPLLKWPFYHQNRPKNRQIWSGNRKKAKNGKNSKNDQKLKNR